MKENIIQYLLLKISSLKTPYRLDPQYYINQFDEKEFFFPKYSFDCYIELISNGFEHRRYEDSGNKYIRSGDLDNAVISNLNYVKIPSDIIVPQRVIIHKNDLIMIRSGDAGKLAIVQKLFDNSISSSDFIILKIKGISPKYLFFYLNTKIVQEVIGSKLSASALPKISQIMINEIPIVDCSSQIINYDKLCDIFHYYFYLAEAMVQWIPEFTLNYLGIKMPKESDELFFTVRPDEINSDYEYRLSPRMERGKRTTLKIINKISKPKYLSDEVDMMRKMINPMNTPTKTFTLLHFANYDPKTMEVKPIQQLGKDFTQNQVIVPDDTIIVGGKSTNKQKIFSSPNLPDTIVYYLSVVFRPNGNKSYMKALWLTDFIQNQIAYLLAGKSEENMSPFYFSKLFIPETTPNIQNQVGDFFDKTLLFRKQLYFISKKLFEIGIILLDRLIEAKTDEERVKIINLLKEINQDVGINIFKNNFSEFSDYYKNYINKEEYERLIKNIPDDYQYGQFEDYKQAGKYIDGEKLEILKEILEKYEKIVLSQGEVIDEKTDRLVDLIARILNEGPANLASLLNSLHQQYPDTIKPYGSELEETLKNALIRHTQLFKYDSSFKAWELVDYQRIEILNLQKEGKKQYLGYKKETEVNSEAKPPQQRLLLYAMIAFLEEGNEQPAAEVAVLIDEKKLTDEERKLFTSRKWKLEKIRSSL